MSAPLVIDLPAGTTDAITIRNSSGVVVGGLRMDSNGRLAIFGPNHSSNAITVRGNDKVYVGSTVPADSEQAAHVMIEDDVHLTGTLRVGIPDAFVGMPIDPRGAIQLGRTSATGQNQTISLIRLYRKNHSTGLSEECGRIGIDADGFPCIMQGTQDVPLLTMRPSGAVWMYGDYNGQRIGVELTINNGSLKGQHGVSGKITDVVPY